MMTLQPHRKNRKSKIDTLPEEIKSALNLLLREGKMSQQAVREQINTLIVQNGVTDDNDYIKRNALSRYSIAFEKGMKNYRQAQQMTNSWVRQFGEMPQTDIARVLIEIGKSQIFDYQMKVLDGSEEIDPKTIGQLALATKRLQDAQSASVKLEKEIRKQAIEDAADKAEAFAQKAGLTADTVKLLKAELLGID